MTTSSSPSVALVALHEAGAADALLVDNLLQLYIHDLSALFPHVELGEDGRYRYPFLASYFDGAPGRRAFVIRVAGSLAGLALAKQGSPVLPDARVWDVAELFVLRRFRGSGVGRAAALRVWEVLGGDWTVRVANKNAPALAFWRRAVTGYRAGTVRELGWSQSGEPWTVFHLQPNE
jgi:predicted acetyltransferase